MNPSYSNFKLNFDNHVVAMRRLASVLILFFGQVASNSSAQTLGRNGDNNTSETLRFEAESTELQELPTSYDIINDLNASCGALAVLNATAPSQSVTYKVLIPEAGTYEIAVGIKTGNDRGRFQFSIDGEDFGAVQEGYSLIPDCEHRVVATTVTFYSPGEKAFTFSLIGRDRRSLGYALELDYIDVRPRLGFASELFTEALSQLPQRAVAGGGDGLWEQYGVASTGVTLRWKVFMPADPGPHPAVIVLHGGGFKSGTAGPDSVSKDLAAAGFLALSTEYRLAPPHIPMNEADHGPVGQDSVIPVDDGHYPAQNVDVQMAIRAARADARCNGLVYGVGGSAGGSHVLYAMATGVPGDDQFDLGVSLSAPAKHDDVAWLQEPCVSNETCPRSAIENYIGIPTGSALSNLPQVSVASPTTYLNSGLPPFFFLYSDHDASALETLQRPALTNALQAAGITESTAARPRIGKYKQLLIATGEGTYHAFQFWNLPIDLTSGSALTKDVIIAWLQAGPPGATPTPTPTPAATITPTPTATPTPTTTPNPTPMAPSITLQPANRSVTEGASATFNVRAAGDAPLTYQWRKNGSNIADATASFYTTPATVATDNNSLFSVVITNGVGSVTSNDAKLSVKTPPTITSQPLNQRVSAGQIATFDVTASGTAPLTYQWRKNGIDIIGATTRTYTTPPTTGTDNKSTYAVVVTNSVGSATSNDARLNVR
ncbi:MAG TPA: immunoglobulin domain-containing protein [Candidatus Udaeobacter sp.]|nr:immunoglobulin domain-containing protein [Candidatus Udaeobacter sp.]